MTGSDVKRMCWAERRARLEGLREAVWCAMTTQVWCAMTTREIAAASGLDLLTVRPRVTELCQLGFAECVGHSKQDGLYRRIPIEAARAECERYERIQMEMF